MKEFNTTFREKLKKVDPCLLICTSILSLASILLMIGLRDASEIGNSTRIIVMQSTTTVIGILAAFFISTLDYQEIVNKLYIPFFIVQIGLLGITLLYGTAEGSNQSWLYIGSIGIQPSEFVKATFIVTFSKHIDIVKKKINHPLSLLGLLAHAGLVIGLILLSGDLGVALVYCGLVLIMLFCSGISLFYLLGGFAFLFIAVPYVWPHLNSYQQDRILFGFTPEADPQGYGFQALLGQKCVANGGFFGQGLNGGEYYKTLFACENDFAFSTLCEKFGMFGGLIVIVTLTVLVVRIFMIARSARKDSGAYLCIGVAAIITVQTIENIGMSLAMLPVVGITLPFISYGGSSTLAMYIMIGMVHSVHAHRVKYFFEREEM
jgi:rod shape determining protein RodA